MKVAAIYLSERSFPRFYNPQGLELAPGDICIVEDSQISEAPGRVGMIENRCEDVPGQVKFPRVLRMASDLEAEQWRGFKPREMAAMEMAKEASRRLNLEMKISTVRFDDRQRRVIFNFTADQRVDFRQLVRDLASALKARIELWQVGVRDESKGLRGYGICGEQLCCGCWIHEFKPVSIRQAKDQDLMLSPTKLSGQCGRLLCCLTYEHEQYRQAAKGVPYIGAICKTRSNGEVIVLDRNLLARKCTGRDQQGHTHSIGFDDVLEIVGKAPPSALRQDPAARLAALGTMPNERVNTLATNMRAAQAAEQQSVADAAAEGFPIIVEDGEEKIPLTQLEDEPAPAVAAIVETHSASDVQAKVEEIQPHHTRRQRFNRDKPHSHHAEGTPRQGGGGKPGGSQQPQAAKRPDRPQKPSQPKEQKEQKTAEAGAPQTQPAHHHRRFRSRRQRPAGGSGSGGGEAKG